MARRVTVLAACLSSIGPLFAQGVPVHDGGLTARDVLETRARETDLALQRQILDLQGTLTEIEQEQLALLQDILDAQTSFDRQGLPGMVSQLEAGENDGTYAASAVYGAEGLDPNPGSTQIFGDAAEWKRRCEIRPR